MKRIMMIVLLYMMAVTTAQAASTTIQLRRDTAANWAQYNPVLAPGEVACEMSGTPARCTAQKIGDGATAWTALPYSTIDALTSTSSTQPLSAKQGKALKDLIDAQAAGIAATSESTLISALATGKKVIVTSPITISAPVSMMTGQEIEILSSGNITAAVGFSGAAMIVVDAASNNVSDMQNVTIHGKGTINGAGYANIGVYVKQARQSRITDLNIVGCVINGVKVGDSTALSSSYEITTSNTTIRNAGGTNNPSSTGILYDNVTDSLIHNNVVVGYRTGIRTNGANIIQTFNHPWTLSSYGPMQYCFYVAGSGARLEGNYADSPTPLADETIATVYGYYLDAYNTHMSNNSGYLAPGTSVDNKAVGVYVVKNDGLYGRITGGHFGGSNGVKWQAVIGGNYSSNTEISGITSDGNAYTSNIGNRILGMQLPVTNNYNLNMTPGDGASDKSAWYAVNARAKFGYDGSRGTVDISDNGGNKDISFTINGAERVRFGANGPTFNNVPVYTDNAAAIAGGLVAGKVYRTATGQLMIRY